MKTSSMRILCLVLPCLLGRVSAIYNPILEHAGATFFDRFSYYGNVDNTSWGNATYLDQPSAVAQKLTFINDAGNAIVKVDNTTTLVAGGPLDVVNRNSIRLTSLDTYGLGSLIVMDAVHIPFGCSVWPSFWTFGMESTWPGSGEIDIIEAINGMDNNQIALHTLPGCTQGQAPQSGTTTETDCSPKRGCTVTENKPNSFGPGFATAGGGVFALQMEATGINLWFWSRADIPADILSATSSTPMDPSTWGMPSAAYPSSTCDITQFFPPQNLVLLTTLCGSWAGVPSIYSSTCPGDCFASNVLGNGSNYADAYWEVKYIRTYISPDVPQTGSVAALTSSISAATNAATGAASTPAVVETGGNTSPSATPHSSSAASFKLWAPVWLSALMGSLFNLL
ncbi:concanavalin A-like lectin/glucanase domain-containing protein [Pholiota molesta]|nr:concanavalin A-like lectin/glucanase domain-containing protein [Pholiota molesta]